MVSALQVEGLMAHWRSGTALAAAVFSLGGAHVREVPEAPPFPDPVLLSQANCLGADAGARRLQVFLGAAQAYAQVNGTSNPFAAGLAEPVLTYAISTEIPRAQDLFDLGLSLVISFNHDAAVSVFQEAQAADPDCAMCYWGEAFARGSNINIMAAESSLQAAAEVSARAVELSGDAPDAERVLIEAMAQRYIAGSEGAVTEDVVAFADALGAAAAAFPEDDFILSLAAEANMNTQPWDYWEADGYTPRGRTAETIGLLETILARDPDHVHAIHLYIHATEASSDPWRAEDLAGKLPALAPQSGHLVHMPSHIYFLTGRWQRSIDVNVAAAGADEAYIAGGDAPALYEFGYYPHNLHFILTSAQMSGDGPLALDYAERLDAALPAEMADLAPWVALIKPAPYFAHAQFSAPETILALEDPGDAYVLNKAAWHYARGGAFVKSGDAQSAQAEAAAIEALVTSPGIGALEAAFVPAGDVLRIASMTVKAKVAAAAGDLDTAIALMQAAVDLEEALPYFEPPMWYYPSRQTLAGLLLQDGQARRAEKMFYSTLIDVPNNAYALYGLWQAFEAEGNVRSADYAQHLFKLAWMGPEGTLPALPDL